MFNYVSVQTFEFLYSAIFGAILGIFYDLIRVVRSYMPKRNLITAITDILFWFFSIIALIAFVLIFCNGKMRWYVLFGAFCGCFVYITAFGKIVFSVVRSIVEAAKKILELITHPVYLILRYIWRGGKRIERKTENKLREKTRRCLNKRKAGRDGNKQKAKKAKRLNP